MTIHVSSEGQVRTIRIDRPDRANAVDPPTSAALGAALSDAERDPDARCVILTGTGDRAFCAGADLRAWQESPPAPGSGTPPGWDVLTERHYGTPVIAAVNGAAVGGGLGLVLASDLVVAAEHASFAMPEVQRGLVGAGVASRAALRLPPAITLELALTGEPIDAARAERLGIVNRVVPAPELLAAAGALAARIAANGPLAVAAVRRIVAEVRPLTVVDMAPLRAMAATAQNSADAREGRAAFLEKRPPRFEGR